MAYFSLIIYSSSEYSFFFLPNNANAPKPNKQGIWIQSDWATLADNQGTIPAPAASITKVATTIASIDKWGLGYRFLTKFLPSGIAVITNEDGSQSFTVNATEVLSDNIEGSNAQSTPEPSSVIGLLGLGALALFGKKKKEYSDDE